MKGNFMKKRKLASILMAVVFTMSIVMGCGAIDEDKKTSDNVATTEKETTTEPVTEPPFEPVSINVMMIGDMLMHMGVQNSGRLADGSLNYDHLFAHIKSDIDEADIAIVNQEVIIGGEELGLSGYPTFNCAYEVGDAIAKAGFNVVLHATNHTVDKGGVGVDNCINFWKTKHPDIAYLGINETAEDKNNIYVYEQDGVKIAILNYTYGTNGIPLPQDRPYLVNLLDEDTVKNDLAKAKELADFIIVCPHWGTEYTLVETEEQHYWANLFVENGANLIIGAHPHVIEPVAWVESENGNKALCYYSLGNFVSTQNEASNMLGAMAKVTITNDKDGNVFIKDYSVEPLVTQKLWGTQEITTYKLSDYTAQLASQNRILDKDPGFSMSYLVNTCRQVFGDLYVPMGEALNYIGN